MVPTATILFRGEKKTTSGRFGRKRGQGKTKKECKRSDERGPEGGSGSHQANLWRRGFDSNLKKNEIGHKKRKKPESQTARKTECILNGIQ